MHGFTGAVDKVPYALGRYLVEGRGQECLVSDNAFGSLPHETLSKLESQGYLTRMDYEEERKLLIRIAATLHQSDLERSPTSFMFVPTFTCNLRCPYCFQSHDMHAGRGSFNAVISRERVDDAFRIIDRFRHHGAVAAALGLVEQSQSNNSDTDHHRKSPIGLFGGEPLSAATLPIVTYIVEQATLRGTALTAVTNGVQLDKFVELLGPGLIEDLQITLDGLAELHDNRRIGPEFRKTFDIIVANIKIALERGARISVRMNVDKTNIGDIRQLNEFFRHLGWNDDPRFTAYAAVVHSEGLHPDRISQAELVDLTTELKDFHNSPIESYEKWASEALSRCLGSNDYPFQRVAHCAAETGMFIFDPLGDVYACWEEVGEWQQRIATYGRDGIEFVQEVAGQWLARFPGTIEQCSGCPYALIHTSGCASHARKSSGTMFASACESFQEFFPQTLARAYQEYEALLFDPDKATRPKKVLPMFNPSGAIID